MRIRILPNAKVDLEIGSDFYEAQQVGLGDYYMSCLISEVESLNLLQSTIASSQNQLTFTLFLIVDNYLTRQKSDCMTSIPNNICCTFEKYAQRIKTRRHTASGVH